MPNLGLILSQTYLQLISSLIYCGGFVFEHAAYGASMDYTSEITAPPSHMRSSRYLILDMKS